MKLWEFIETLEAGDEWLCLDTNRRLVMTERGLRYAGGESGSGYLRVNAESLAAEYVQAQLTEVEPHQAIRALDNGRRVYASYDGGPLEEIKYDPDGYLIRVGLNINATISRSATYYVRGAIDPPEET